MHHVAPKTLINYEILPWQGKAAADLPQYARVHTFWNSNALRLNGTTSVAHEWVKTLQTLTGCHNLRYLTMLTWSKVIAVNRVLRQSKAWCPQCYQDRQQAGQIIYEPGTERR
jgi:hypothetical protein